MIPVHVIVTGRNTQPFIKRHMAELRAQVGIGWRCTWIDDASDDGSYVEALGYAGTDERIRVITNSRRFGPMPNIVQGMSLAKEHEVIVLWDGDDFFAHDRVLERIATEFLNPHTWMTYGSFLTVDGRDLYSGAYADDVVAEGSYRAAPWRCAPPRAFRAQLFQRLPRSVLLDDDGRPWACTTDQAICLPMLELARGHARYIPDVLYLYNDINPLSDHNVRPREQVEAMQRIRARAPLAPLDASTC